MLQQIDVDGFPILKLTDDEIAAANLRPLCDQIDEYLGEGRPCVVSLEHTRLNSLLLTVLISWRRRAAPKGAYIILVVPDPLAMETLYTISFNYLFSICATVDEAVREARQFGV